MAKAGTVHNMCRPNLSRRGHASDHRVRRRFGPRAIIRNVFDAYEVELTASRAREAANEDGYPLRLTTNPKPQQSRWCRERDVGWSWRL
jgi:hypothetical protein